MLAVGRVCTSLRALLAAIFTLALTAVAQAQPIMHRDAAPAGEASPTGGSFSIQFPVAFRDMETKIPDPERGTISVRLLSGAGSDNIRFSAMEVPRLKGDKPLESFVEEVGKRPGASISDVKRERVGDLETLSFTYRDPREMSFFQISRNQQNGYTLVMQFPETQLAKATGMKDKFFRSFKTTTP